MRHLLTRTRSGHRRLVNVPPMSNHRGTDGHDVALDAGQAGARCSLERR